jgi:hypothetical protein
VQVTVGPACARPITVNAFQRIDGIRLYHVEGSLQTLGFNCQLTLPLGFDLPLPLGFNCQLALPLGFDLPLPLGFNCQLALPLGFDLPLPLDLLLLPLVVDCRLPPVCLFPLGAAFRLRVFLSFLLLLGISFGLGFTSRLPDRRPARLALLVCFSRGSAASTARYSWLVDACRSRRLGCLCACAACHGESSRNHHKAKHGLSCASHYFRAGSRKAKGGSN